MTKESIYKFYEKKLIEYLDSEFEEYCTCDDYYEPVVEDFELTYDVEHWCKAVSYTHLTLPTIA